INIFCVVQSLTLPGCPMPPGFAANPVGNCLEQCSKDSDCPGDDQICCFNGCGHVECKYPVFWPPIGRR
uniref:WAP domain-containing protein n=1 Tax=Nothobranchius furzeri TaxID=105023 RepID=A0A8C6PIB7_NOTFU